MKHLVIFLAAMLFSFSAFATDIVINLGESIEVDGAVVSCAPQAVAYKNCAGRLLKLKPDWSSATLAKACKGAGGDCVVSLALQKPKWSSETLNNACFGDRTGCAGTLAKVKPDWSSTTLSKACYGADGSCVISIAKQQPGWSSETLNRACQL